MRMRLSLLVVGMLFISFLSPGQNLDPTFQMPLMVRQADIHEIAWLDNGKILLGGKIDFYDDASVSHLIRLNEDGSLDDTFHLNPEMGVVKALQVLPSGEIVVGTSSKVYLLDADGQITESFPLNTSDDLQDIVYADGKLWISVKRNFSSYRVMRYQTDLVQDVSFSEVVVNGFVGGMNVHQGKLILAGIGSIVRFNDDGTVDDSFNLSAAIPEGYNSIEGVLFRKILIASDDKILIQSNGYNGILKLNEDGSQDFDFVLDENALRHVDIKEVFLDASNNIFVIGYSNYFGNNDSYDSRILKYAYSGSLDGDFQISSLTEKNEKTDPVIEVNSSGEVLFANINNLSNRYGLNKLFVNGIVDATFTPEVGTYGIVDVAEINGNKFVVAGDFNRLDQFETNDVAVFYLTGQVDETFQYTGHLERTPTDIAFHEGNIYLANETEVHKLQSNGQPDQTFNTKPEFLYAGFPIEWFCSKIHIQNDGKIVTTSGNGVFRMLANGEPDNTYGPFYPSSSSTAYSSDMVKDGKILFGSYFDNINGTAFNDIVRINVDGSFDDSFRVERDATPGYWPGITDITALTNNETMVFGYFDRFGGHAAPKGMAKLNENGKVDKWFLTFLNRTFQEEATGFKNYSSFRGGFMVTGYTDVFQVGDEFVFDYQLYVFNKSGIYQSQFHLPTGYKASKEIIPLVITNNDIILISNFIVESNEPTSGIRLRMNGLPTITSYVQDIVVATNNTGFDVNYDHLEVTDTDNVYPDDFSIKVYEGENFTVSGNMVVPRAGFNGIIEVPVTVTEGSNESNHVLVPIMVGDGILSAKEDANFKIFPNPTTDMVQIEMDQIKGVELRDVSGQLIKATITDGKVDLSNMPNGMYVLRVIDQSDEVYLKRIIKR